jgi:hypothetical protein
MIDPFETYEDFSSAVNTFQGGHFRLNRDFIRALNNISDEIWEEEAGQSEKTQTLSDHLTPFLQTVNAVVKTLNKTEDYFEFPKDYGRVCSARVLLSKETQKGVKENGVRMLQDGKILEASEDDEVAQEYETFTATKVDISRWNGAIKDAVKGPKMNTPIYSQFKQGFRVAPKNVGTIVIDFYTKPKPAILEYDIAPGNPQTGAGDYVIYNKLESQPLEWPSTMKNEFVMRLGERYGVFTRDQFLAAVTKTKK